MIRIAIELNHVVRNINQQIYKYYQKDIDQSFDYTNIDIKDDVFKHIKMSKGKKVEFLYIDYPYEVFGCARACEKNLPSEINKWLYDLTNIEDEDFEIFYYSLNEESLTIQSSYFFLSKIGTRVRKVLFPKDVKDVIDSCDVIIGVNNDVLKKAKKEGKIAVHINTNFNKISKNAFDYYYDTLSDLINDKSFIDKLLSNKTNSNVTVWNKIIGFFKKSNK